MAILEKSTLTVNLGIVNTTPANRILAASATVTRWIRGITIVNNNSAGSWNFAVAGGVILTAANSIWFGVPIAANATFVFYFPGAGLRLATTDEIMAFASLANMSLEVSYRELDLT